jgi:hypothetical protein
MRAPVAAGVMLGTRLLDAPGPSAGSSIAFLRTACPRRGHIDARLRYGNAV